MTNFDERDPGRGRTSKEGKPAPPSQILAAPADKLDTSAHPQDVTAAVEEITDALATIVNRLDDPGAYGIYHSMSPTAKAQALADALEAGNLDLSPAGSQEPQSSSGSSGTLQEAVQATRAEASVESDLSKSLLSVLESPEKQGNALSRRLTETIETVDSYRATEQTLTDISRTDHPETISEVLGDLEGTGPIDSQLATAGDTLSETAADLDRCRQERSELAATVANLCARAEEQTGQEIEPHDPGQEIEPHDPEAGEPTEDVETVIERATALEHAVEAEEIWFADGAVPGGWERAALEGAEQAESEPAREFARLLRRPGRADEDEVIEAVIDAVEAIDRSEALRTRLDGVDPDGLVGLADRLLEDIAEEPHPVVSTLRERITDIRESALRANEVDSLTLYAGRQELRYYDRTLIPQLLDGEEPSGQSSPIERRIDELDERRQRMRQSYPTEYPDCDHTIPIYFFDLVSELLETARDQLSRGEHRKAAGLADGAGTTLDWIEGLYETHSYFVLLTELRG